MKANIRKSFAGVTAAALAVTSTFAVSATNEQYPYDYTIENILSDYNLFAAGNLYSPPHTVGAIAVGGNAVLGPWGDGQVAPSYIHYINSYGNNAGGSWIAEEYRNTNVYYGDAEDDLLSGIEGNERFIQNDEYIDFASAMQAISDESLSWRDMADYTVSESDIVPGANEYTITYLNVDFSLGDKINVPYDVLSQVDRINITGVSDMNDLAKGGYTITFTNVGDNEINLTTGYAGPNSGKISISLNGGEDINAGNLSNKFLSIDGGENGGQLNLTGMNFVLNFPDASGNIFYEYATGHVVAPNENVNVCLKDKLSASGNSEGGVISGGNIETAGEAHFLPYFSPNQRFIDGELVDVDDNGDDTTPASTPSETTPASTPSQTTPASTPSETTPASTPSETTPASTPSETTPASTPSETTPASTPSETTPASTPSETTPASTPSETTPASTPSETTPATTPSQTTPSQTTPATTPSQTTSATTPSQTTPATTPSQTTPATTPSESAPETTPSESAPETTPSESAPETTPSESVPETTPSESAPETTPSESAPETTPSESAPETTPSESAPETTPSESAPETDPSESDTEATEATTVPTETTPSEDTTTAPTTTTPESTTTPPVTTTEEVITTTPTTTTTGPKGDDDDDDVADDNDSGNGDGNDDDDENGYGDDDENKKTSTTPTDANTDNGNAGKNPDTGMGGYASLSVTALLTAAAALYIGKKKYKDND